MKVVFDLLGGGVAGQALDVSLVQQLPQLEHAAAAIRTRTARLLQLMNRRVTRSDARLDLPVADAFADADNQSMVPSFLKMITTFNKARKAHRGSFLQCRGGEVRSELRSLLDHFRLVWQHAASL